MSTLAIVGICLSMTASVLSICISLKTLLHLKDLKQLIKVWRLRL